MSLSATSGRPGQKIVVTPIDPCPALPAGFNNQHVEFTFVDANNVHTVSDYPATTNTDGTWNSDGGLVIPWRDVMGNHDPIDTVNEAASGMGSVQARCIISQPGGDDMDPSDDITQTAATYAPQPFNVTGSSFEFSVAATAVSGSTVHVTSFDPCPGDQVNVYMARNMQGFSEAHVTPNQDGSWSADVLAGSTDPMSEEVTNFPAGEFEVNAECTTSSGSSFYYYYGEEIVQITMGNYVALGDSYSSGEGVEPFEAGTAIPGTNECHRSQYAYPRMLEATASLSLQIGPNGFAACSGAVTSDVTDGPKYNEGAQMEKITSDTELVTMTIGGNDMGFAEFATSCAMPLSNCSGTSENNAIARISNDVIPHVAAMLGEVRDRLIEVGNSNARVLVLGYPQVLPSVVASGLDIDCLWLDGQQEADAIRHVTTTLNTAIKNEVDAIGYDFHFVSATGNDSYFVGHEVCSPTSNQGTDYFYGAIASPEEKKRYSFHPNALGQWAYTELIKDYLYDHPLN